MLSLHSAKHIHKTEAGVIVGIAEAELKEAQETLGVAEPLEHQELLELREDRNRELLAEQKQEELRPEESNQDVQ